MGNGRGRTEVTVQSRARGVARVFRSPERKSGPRCTLATVLYPDAAIEPAAASVVVESGLGGRIYGTPSCHPQGHLKRGQLHVK